MLRMLALLLACVTATAASAQTAAQTPTRVSVMTFNTWGMGTLSGQSIEQVAAAIRASGGGYRWPAGDQARG